MSTTSARALSDEGVRPSSIPPIRDLSHPEQGTHAIQLVVDALVSALSDSWHSDVRLIRRSPVVTIEDNYERLGYPADAITRDARYTSYVDSTHVLRSASTAMIPGALRALAAEPVVPPDVLIAAPGMCYRRDSVDWQHTGTPHQIDLWRLRTGRPLDDRDLLDMIGLIVGHILPGRRWRTIPARHPYTQNGREIEVWHNDQWVEVGECGLASPTVLADAGLTSSALTGLAMGLGLDRLLLLRKGIPDIRLLRSSDPRIASQMQDLTPYRPVSHMPVVRRDLSLVVADNVDVSDEAIGDRVRTALGEDADVAETVTVLSETSYADLPPAAVVRLGIAPGQRNLLVRLELRALDRTLTDAEANALRDKVYAALHEGTVHTWASST